MRIVLLRPPRYLWPFNAETSAFWQPLGLLCLAAMVRQELPEARIEVIDAPGEQLGWKSLEARLAAERVDVLGLGEEAVSAHEAFRAAALVKRLHPDCTVIAGGCYFAHAIEESLANPNIDAIVRGEGELTFVELLRRLHDRTAWSQIPGIAFRDGGSGGRIVTTAPRALVPDLDTLPFPAYDLIPMHRYGQGSRNHPALVSVEHSRGCIDSCNFCILWRQMGQPNGDGQPHACFRTKSPERTFADVSRLYTDFARQTFGWVDPTFNASPEFSDRFADLLLKSPLMGPAGNPRTLHTAWMRADGIVRDHKLGILEKLVRAGLRQVMIGVERDDDASLALLGKHNQSADTCREAFAILRRHYPQVYTIGSVIFGLPGDTLADLDRLSRLEQTFGMDYCFLIPLTPNPGTAFAHRRNGSPLSHYDFHTPVCTTDRLDLRQLESLYWRIMLRPSLGRVGNFWRQIVREKDARNRRVHLALWTRGTQIAARSLMNRLLHPRRREPASYARRPTWYDS